MLLLAKTPLWLAVFSSSETACLPVRVGNAWRRSARAPATVGAENDVPDTRKQLPLVLQLLTMLSPGATTKPALASKPLASATAEKLEIERFDAPQFAAVRLAPDSAQLTDPTASTEPTYLGSTA